MLLTKKFRKIAALAVLVIVTALLFFKSGTTATIVSKESISSLRNNLEFYHETIKSYAQSLRLYADNISLNPHHKPGDPNDLVNNLLKSPLKTSKSAEEVLQINIKVYDNVLSREIDEPKSSLQKIGDTDPKDYKLENATFVSLVRNSEARAIVSTIKNIEARFNKHYHYPYVFLNDKPFTERFISSIKKVTTSECFFELVDSKDWDKPDSIDPVREQNGIQYLIDKGVGYSSKESYHNMCRYYSRGFYNHKRMEQFKYYWRIEPNTKYFCDIDYDIFKFMRDHDKVYGYVLALYDSPDSVRNLWPTTIDFLNKNPQYLNPNASTVFLTENIQNPETTNIAHGYSTCHFWSNFEIGDMDFYRDEAYSRWVQYLEDSGGFYYERWGDAPVHSIGVGLFASRDRIHWFRDIGYEHAPYSNCPNSKKCQNRCKVGQFSKFNNLFNQNCQATLIEYEMTDQQLAEY